MLKLIKALEREQGESLAALRVRSVRAARRQQLAKVREHLLNYHCAETWEPDNPLYRAVDALTDLIEDIIEREHL